MPAIFAAAFAPLAAFFAKAGAGIAAYFAINGLKIAVKAAPLVTFLLFAALLSVVIGHADIPTALRVFLAAGIVLLTVAAFSLGFQVRDEIPASVLPLDQS